MYSQIQTGEGQSSIPHSFVDTLHDQAPEPKTLHLESGNNNSYVNVKKYMGFYILKSGLTNLVPFIIPYTVEYFLLQKTFNLQ